MLGGGDDDDRLPPVVAQTHVRRPERAKADGLRIKGGLTTERGERANFYPANRHLIRFLTPICSPPAKSISTRRRGKRSIHSDHIITDVSTTQWRTVWSVNVNDRVGGGCVGYVTVDEVVNTCTICIVRNGPPSLVCGHRAC